MCAYRIEQNVVTGEPELVIDGWEEGISDSPHFGIADMRNINNDSQPGIALCNYKLKQISQTPITTRNFTASTSADTITFTGSTLSSSGPVAIKFTGASLPAPLIAGTIYYAVADGTGLTATLWSTWDQFNGTGSQINITTIGSGAMTFSTVNMAGWNTQRYALDIRTGIYYLLDKSGQVWVITSAGALPVLLTGNTLTNGNGNGIAIFKNYLFVFRNSLIDVYGDLSAGSFSWTNGWQTINTSAGTNNPHYAKAGQDDILYYCDGRYLGSVQEIAKKDYTFTFTTSVASGVASATLSTNWTQTTGAYLVLFSSGETRVVTLTNAATTATWTGNTTLNASNTATVKVTNTQTFNPGTATTYIFTLQALTLPINEVSNYLEELYGTTLLLTGTTASNFIYPWDRTSTSFNLPIILPEIGTYAMLNINKLVYILAGQRGNIYYTNGSSLTSFKTIPKYPSKSPYPIYTWGGIMSLNNNLCFGVSDSASGVAGNAGGCWAITLAVGQLLNTVAGAIRYKNQPSIGFYNIDILIPFANGIQFYAAWYNGTNGGIDVLAYATDSSVQYYSSYESYIETDIIPIGTSLQPKTFNTIEAKLDTQTTAGEKFKISMRSDLTPSYTQAFEVTATGSIDGNSSAVGIPIQLGKWVQVKAELQTTGTSNSFVRLKDIRLR